MSLQRPSDAALARAAQLALLLWRLRFHCWPLQGHQPGWTRPWVRHAPQQLHVLPAVNSWQFMCAGLCTHTTNHLCRSGQWDWPDYIPDYIQHPLLLYLAMPRPLHIINNTYTHAYTPAALPALPAVHVPGVPPRQLASLDAATGQTAARLCVHRHLHSCCSKSSGCFQQQQQRHLWQ